MRNYFGDKNVYFPVAMDQMTRIFISILITFILYLYESTNMQDRKIHGMLNSFLDISCIHNLFLEAEYHSFCSTHFLLKATLG